MYDVYFNEQIEHLALKKCDIILLPGYQRGEATDIIRAQTKLIAFRCNSFVAKSSYSMNSDEKGGCSMIVAPDGKILVDLGKEIGSISAEVDPHFKHTRTAGFGGGIIRKLVFIRKQIIPEIGQIIRFHFGREHGIDQLIHNGVGIHRIQIVLICLLIRSHQGLHHGRHVRFLRLDRNGIGGQRLLLDGVDICLYTVGQG